MPNQHADQLPDTLETLAPEAAFTFACHPGQPCFNRCCSQLLLPLTPYDSLRLADALGLSGQEFLAAFAIGERDAHTGLAAFQLRMLPTPDAPCPFVTPAGCSVYEDRPGACRSYPLGRGARLGAGGVIERFFVIREEHCAGFGCGQPRTPRAWFESQGLEEYNASNDRYMRLLSLIRASGAPIPERMEPMARLSLWQPDEFLDFLKKMDIPGQVRWQGDATALAGSDLAARKAALAFGMDWLELALFGAAQAMRRPAAPRQGRT